MAIMQRFGDHGPGHCVHPFGFAPGPELPRPIRAAPRSESRRRRLIRRREARNCGSPPECSLIAGIVGLFILSAGLIRADITGSQHGGCRCRLPPAHHSAPVEVWPIRRGRLARATACSGARGTAPEAESERRYRCSGR